MAKNADTRLISLGAVAAISASVVFFRTKWLDEEAALSGLSPEQLAMKTNHPEQFLQDFPSGALELLNSVIFHVYPLAEAIGLPISAVWAVMIGIEVVLFGYATGWVFRRLFPDVSWPLTGIAIALYVASKFLGPDLARFNFPYYGWNYGFALSGTLFVIALSVRNKVVSAACVAVATFMVHPIMALFAMAFTGAMGLIKLIDGGFPCMRDSVLAAIIITIGCGGWFAFIASNGTVSGGEVPPETYVAYVRAQNFHWFPSFMGVYWESHERHLFPLLASLSLMAWAIGAQPAASRAIVRQLTAGIVMMLVLCSAGLLIAEFVKAPTLLKLALHRADRVALLIGGFFIIRALYQDLMTGDPIERGLAGFLLATPFIAPYGLAPLPVALRVGYAAFKAYRAGRWPQSLSVAMVPLALIGSLSVYYYSEGLVTLSRWPAYSALYGGLGFVAPAFALLAAFWPASPRRQGAPMRAIAAIGMIAALGLATSTKFETFSTPPARERAKDALDTQLWARENTDTGALFMIDPSLYYMWRDKSHRPSFGTPREWLSISIMYNSRQHLLEEGLKRYRALGLENPDYLYDAGNKRMKPLFTRLIEDAETAYYMLAEEDFKQLSETYGISYFVFRKERLTDGAPLTRVYQNAHFVIAAAP